MSTDTVTESAPTPLPVESVPVDNKCTVEKPQNQAALEMRDELRRLNRTFTSVFNDDFEFADRKYLTDKYEQKFAPVLKTGQREYVERGDRDINPEQNIPRVIRVEIYPKHGYKYDYDIDCCQPSIISQFAQRNGLDSPLPYIVHYINNKHHVRESLSKVLGVDNACIKQVLNAVFNGAPIQFPYCDEVTPAIFKLLGKSNYKLGLLKENHFVHELQQEIKLCWDALAPLIPRKYSAKNRLLPINSGDKSALYRQQETIINRVIRKYVHKIPNSFALSIHDGWLGNMLLNEEELINHVFDETGYNIKLSLEIYD